MGLKIAIVPCLVYQQVFGRAHVGNPLPPAGKENSGKIAAGPLIVMVNLHHILVIQLADRHKGQPFSLQKCRKNIILVGASKNHPVYLVFVNQPF